MILRETIVDIFKPFTQDTIKIHTLRETDCPKEKTMFFIETTNDLIRVPMETMVEICAKMGNYLGFPKMEYTFPLSSSPRVEEKVLQKSEPSPGTPLGSVKTVESY